MAQVAMLTNGIGDVKLGGSLMPTGTVLAFAGISAPSGWLLCDGTAYNQTEFSDLYAALGSLYNTQVNPTTGSAWAAPSAGQFRVPDLRGLFLRGEGTPSGQSSVSVGGHQSQATAKNGLTLGVQNTDHSHYARQLSGPTLNPNSGQGTTNWCAVSAGTNDSSHTTSGVNQNHSHTILGDTETRPMNRGVKYIIKI
jgi:microcystin-dependent protein